ncbi:phospho-N-acetylmuramoyl-pentapeptide-transferase [Candidatus Uhrbacteria bacterium]|nr:phospho-N-acetylmuramoyl-pentapeptide-transferase [Candidatus Uhrbacteria bacterium]
MDLSGIIKIFFLATLAFVVAIAWTPLLTHFLYRYRMGKQIRDAGSAPVFARLHGVKGGTPTMGGILIWLTVLVLAIFFHLAAVTWGGFFGAIDFLSREETFLPLGVMVAAALVGLVDDYWNARRIGPKGGGLRTRHRLVLYAAIAAVGAWWFYGKLGWDTLHVPFVGDFGIGWWYVPFFVLVIVATSFSVNETDGLDGLAGGPLAAAFAAYAGIAFMQGKVDLAAFCGLVCGALLAFLWFNINPARFFMGDTGAMSLGVTLGVVAMLTDTALFLPLIGLIFVLESLSVIVQVSYRKLRGGRKLFLSSPIHHHLEAIGWPEPKVVMRFWVIATVSSVFGLVAVLADRIYFR